MKKIGLLICVAVSVVLAVTACQENGGGAEPDAAAADAAGDADAGDADAGAAGDAGADAPGGGLRGEVFVAGEVYFIGITTGATPHVVYYVARGDVYDVTAAPLDGGPATVLQEAIGAADAAYVRGSVVFWYEGTDPVTSIASAIHLWTAEHGATELVTPTAAGFCYASDDGVRVAFAVESTPASTGLAITSSAAPVARPELTGDHAINLAALEQCYPFIGFAGPMFVAAYCTGTEATAAGARLVTAAPDGAPIVRVDGAVDPIIPLWFADGTGEKILVRGLPPESQGRVVLASGEATGFEDLEPDVVQGRVARDGSFVFYRTSSGALKKRTLGARPTTITIEPEGVLGLFGLREDNARLLYYTQHTQQGDADVVDARVVDLAVEAPAPVIILPTATAMIIAFSGSTDHVVSLEDPIDYVGPMNARPSTGGPAVELAATAYLPVVPPTGDAVFVATSLEETDLVPLVDLRYIDLVTGVAYDDVVRELSYGFNIDGDFLFGWSGKTFVYMSHGASPGLYTLEMP